MPECLELFPLKVYKDVYSKTDDLKNNLFTKLKEVFDKSQQNNNVFMQDGTLCSYDSNAQLHTQFPDETKDIVDFVEQSAKEYWKQCNYHEGLTPFVFQMWANTTPRGGYIDPHLHGNMPFTAVVYVDASPEQGNIILDNPLDMILMTQPISPSIKYPLGQEISVNTGDLLMFPGYLKHRVKPNTIDRNRLILGFNIGCRGNYWASQWVHDV